MRGPGKRKEPVGRLEFSRAARRRREPAAVSGGDRGRGEGRSGGGSRPSTSGGSCARPIGARRPGAIGALLRREGLYSSHLTHLAGGARSRGTGGAGAEEARAEGTAARSARQADRRAGARDRASGRSARSGRRRWSRSKKKSRRCWGRRSTARNRDGDGQRASGRGWAWRATCAALGLAAATYYRRRCPRPTPPRRPSPPRTLPAAERTAVLEVLHAPPLRRPAPPRRSTRSCSTRAATSARSARCTASWPPISEVRERRDQLRPSALRGPELLATGPNQVWSWDITKLLGPGEVDVLLPLRDPRRLQPLRRRLDGRPPRERGARRDG